MYAHIYAESLDNYSTGKKTFVYLDPKALKAEVVDGKLSVSGRYQHEASSGSRGGDAKVVFRDLRIDLSSDDIRALVASALDRGLLARCDLSGLSLRDQLREQIARGAELAAENDSLKSELTRLRTVIDDCRAALDAVSPP